MTFRPLLLSAALGIALVACGETAPSGPDAVGEDLTRLCTALTAFEARTFADGFERSAALGAAVEGSVHESETRAFMASLGTQAPASRVASLRAFAARHGLPNYSCPALEH